MDCECKVEKVFFISEELLDFDKAEESCRSIAGILAEPDAQAENIEVKSMLQSKAPFYFLGVFNRANRCVVVESKTGDWYIRKCSENLPFICETPSKSKW